MMNNIFKKSFVIGIISMFLFSNAVTGFNIKINNNIMSFGWGNTLYILCSGIYVLISTRGNDEKRI